MHQNTRESDETLNLNRCRRLFWNVYPTARGFHALFRITISGSSVTGMPRLGLIWIHKSFLRKFFALSQISSRNHLPIRSCINFILRKKIFRIRLKKLKRPLPMHVVWFWTPFVNYWKTRWDTVVKVPIASNCKGVCLQNTSKSYSYHLKIWQL